MTQDEFTQKITDMQPSLYRIAYGLMKNQADCKDAIQEALLRAWQKRHRLRDETAVKAWVIRILINVCRTQLRKRKRAQTAESGLPWEYPPGSDHDLHDAMAALDEKLRLPIILHYMEGYSIGEIADMLSCPIGTVKSRLRKGKAELKQALSSESPYGQGGSTHEKV